MEASNSAESCAHCRRHCRSSFSLPGTATWTPSPVCAWGQTDYLTKDISLAHLTARIAALFRRIEALQQPVKEERVIKRGALHLDLDRLQVQWQDTPLDLTLTELWFVRALADHPGHVRSRDQLMDAANILVDATSISTHIKRVRRKFETVDSAFNAIETVYGMGYRWNAS